MAELFFSGPSEIDGNPIKGYITENSSNRKTGNMLQTWIVVDGMSPTEACKTGADKSICGNCIHRPSNGATCYVLVHQAPTAIQKFPPNTLSQQSKGVPLRLGAYGDPTAIPFGAWQQLLAKLHRPNHTGYTHQWSTCDKQFRTLCMASVDNEQEYFSATKQGWRTYRVKTANEPLLNGEIYCPSYKGVQCADCKLCSGTSIKAPNIAIDVHGSKSKINLFEQNYANKS